MVVKNKTVIMAIGSLFLVAGSQVMAQDAIPEETALTRGEEVFDICAACHGDYAEGSEDLEAPKLAGQYGWYLLTQLRNFRAEIRGVDDADVNGQIMQPMAADLEDQELDDVVAYITTLDPNYVPEDE